MILIDQLNDIYIDADLETVDTAQWYPKVMRKDYTAALSLAGCIAEDPDQGLYENYTCGAEGNYDGYCNPELGNWSIGNRWGTVGGSARN